MATWNPLGATDEQPLTCGRCGKDHLQRLVVLENEDGEQIRVGTTCAAKLIGDSRTAKKTVDTADLLQRIVDKLRSSGLADTKEWTRINGIGCSIKKIGNPARNIYRVWFDGRPLIVTDTLIRTDTMTMTVGVTA